jgi:hypothetical protein
MRPLAFLFALLLAASIAEASSGPRWTPAELAEFADIVITGRVETISSAFDHEVNAIYTYVTVDVTEVLKGDIETERITIKQLGGASAGFVLSVTDQATFTIGEDVLLYLEARPRDGTLYTSALWQGKWNVQRGWRGQQVAVRQSPGIHGDIKESQALSDARTFAAAAGRSMADRIVTDPIVIEPTAADAVPRASAGFNLLGPFRYVHSPVVEVQASGQPGLAGGGFTQVQTSIHRWNSAGSSFRFVFGGGNGAPRCSGEMLGNGRVTITFMDPCGEMSNSGGTLALGGSYYVAGEGGSLNGQDFDRAVEGFIVNNDSPTALSYLTNPGCFEDVQTHELGHVLGLNHSSDPGALMYATIDGTTCRSGARGLMRDDIEGVLFIYGRTSTVSSFTPPTAPVNVQVMTQLPQLTVTWSELPLDTAAAATSYRVDFRAGHADGGPIVASVTQTGKALTVVVPPGVSGPFNVVITGINAAGAGPSSERRDFVIGVSNSGCAAAPQAVTQLTGTISNGFARVNWAASAGATRYLIQAGSTRGASDLFSTTDLGASTSAGAPVPADFSGWVRVYAGNACGVSAPSDFLLQQ